MTEIRNNPTRFANAIPVPLLVATFAFAVIAASILVLRGQAGIGATAAALGGFAALTLAFGRMTVTVGETEISWQFALPLIGDKLPLYRVREVSLAEKSWVYGYGWRWTFRGPLWRAWGYRVVALERTDGRTTYLGSDDPEALAEGIRIALARRRAALDTPHEGE